MTAPVDQARALTGRARAAARVLSRATAADKDSALSFVAAALEQGAHHDAVLRANGEDLEAAAQAGLSAALIDRLRLDEERLSQLAGAVRQIVSLPDPVGLVEETTARPSGIEVARMRVPLGVILIVYEARPNVTIDAAALCVKSGNAVLLRGGREALRTNFALAQLFGAGLAHAGLPPDAALFIDEPDRELLYALLRRAGEIDLAIPRGGTALIDAVNQHARVPVVQHYQGICHVYVHARANLEMAERIVVNAKVQRPGVCNAMECLVVDAAIAPTFLPRIATALRGHGVELRVCERALAVLGEGPGVVAAAPQDYDTEFLDLRCALKVVEGYDEALRFLEDHGSQHSECIVTDDADLARRFQREVDASCVLVNASTRFNDGGELGLGAELGISTTKLHAYGPMGLRELTTRKFLVSGHGETRGSPP